MKTTSCNGEKLYSFNNAPRCGAKTRRGTACQSPAVKGKSRCRFHGCGKGSGAPKGNNYAVTHGFTTTKAKLFRKEVQEMGKATRALAKSLARIIR